MDAVNEVFRYFITNKEKLEFREGFVMNALSDFVRMLCIKAGEYNAGYRSE